MRHFFKYSFPFLILLIFSSSCKREDINTQDELPPITQVGLNTFGCKIDGEVFIPKNGEPDFFVRASTGLRIIFGTEFNSESGGDDVSISASNGKIENGDFVFLYIDSLSSIGNFEIFNSNGSSVNPEKNPHGFIVTYVHGQRKKYLSFSNAGQIKVEALDFNSQIIAGTFEFRAVNEADNTDTVSVTEGRFDINWSTLNQE